MKPSTKILSLSLCLTGIVTFWLIPKINQASDLNYVRMIEDTETEPKVIVTPVENPDTTSISKREKKENVNTKASGSEKAKEKKNVEKKKDTKKVKKKYKKEVIKSDYTWDDIDAKMYSRAIHFHPEEKIFILDSLTADSSISIQ